MISPSAEELRDLEGRELPGGVDRVERWENRLLTECTGRAPLADGLVHPVALFHLPIRGVGTSIAELFAQARVQAGDQVRLDRYDWTWRRPLREDADLVFSGRIAAARRHRDDDGVHDEFVFSIEGGDADGPVVAVTNQWRIVRSGVAKSRPAPALDPPATRSETVPSWTMPSVSPDRMRTMAALLRDPYPVHYDRDAVAAMGRGSRLINQGPLNLGYVMNMLMAWHGDDCLRRITVGFHGPVCEGDEVIARGEVVDRSVVDTEERSTCAVRLANDGADVVVGTAVVATSTVPM